MGFHKAMIMSTARVYKGTRVYSSRMEIGGRRSSGELGFARNKAPSMRVCRALFGNGGIRVDSKIAMYCAHRIKMWCVSTNKEK